MYADNQVIISDTVKNGTLNTHKTNIIVFNIQGKGIKKYSFTNNEKVVENVNRYYYLGIVFQTTGNFKEAIKALSEKAQRAIV